MNRQEFVARLEAALQGKVPASAVQSNVQYYNDYILTEVSGGRPETEVLEELGDPRLIARTIFDSLEAANGSFGRETYTFREEESRGTWEGEARRGTAEAGGILSSDGLRDILIRLRPTLILVGILVAVIAVVSLVFSAALVILINPVFWCALAVWVIWRIFGRR